MTNPFRRRLSYRLTRDTVLLAMLVGLILNLIQVTLEYSGARQAMDADIQALLDISESPASQIAYNIDARLAGELLQGLLNHPAVIDARILDPEQGTMAAASRSSIDSSYRWLSEVLFGSSHTYRTALGVPQLPDVPLGELVVTIDTHHYGRNFLARAGFILVSGFAKSVALSIMLLFVFYFVLTKPMLRVTDALERMDPEADRERVPVPATHEEDEIGVMVAIINRHLETVSSSMGQLRQVENQMRHHSSRLEREVADRTREISEKNDALQRGNRALIRAKEDAVRRAQARASFLASMSHEIRTPLNGVLGMLELVLEREMDPGQRQQLEIAHNAGNSLLGLLNDILDISKVEAGKLGLETIAFSLQDLVEECATIHAEQARRKGLNFSTRIDPALAGQYLGDPTRIRQVVNNLLANAIKFTDEGEIRIRVGPAAQGIRLEVEDSGIGMSEDGLARIFSPFSQADTDTTRRFGGTGLGLALCQQLVQRMHGQIQVKSREHQGTRFLVTLPLAPARPDTRERPPQALPGADAVPPRLRILLAEDNRVNQIVASGLLQKLGHDVDHVDNGERALQALAERHYDMVLMDCQMPVMDGYEATRRIRHQPRWRSLPVIAVTANVMTGDQQDCLAAGMNDFMSKPYNRQDLETMIARWSPAPTD